RLIPHRRRDPTQPGRRLDLFWGKRRQAESSGHQCATLDARKRRCQGEETHCGTRQAEPGGSPHGRGAKVLCHHTGQSARLNGSAVQGDDRESTGVSLLRWLRTASAGRPREDAGQGQRAEGKSKGREAETMNERFAVAQLFSFPSSAWERTAREALL